MIRQFLTHAAFAMLGLTLLPAYCQAATIKTHDIRSAAARWSQLTDAVFKKFTTENGLCGNSVTALNESADGFLWIGTASGLARFDGYQFKNYLYDEDNRNSLPDNFVIALHADHKGELWVGTYGGGLVHYDRDNDRFDRISLRQGSLLRDFITDIADADANGLWIGTSEGLIYLDLESGKVSPYLHNDSNTENISEGLILSVKQDRHHTLWVSTTLGLFRRNSGADHFVRVPLPGKMSGKINRLYESSDGRIWIGSAGAVYVLNPDTGVVREIREPISHRQSLEIDAFTFAEASSGEIWIGGRRGGIAIVDPSTLRARLVHHDPMLANSLPSDVVWALYKDRSGLLWAGTGVGLARYNHSPGIETLYGASSKPKSVSQRGITSVMQTDNGNIWLGFNNDGLDIVDPIMGRIAALRSTGGVLKREGISALTIGPDGMAYMVTTHGLYRADQSGKNIVRIHLQPNPAATIQSLHFEGSRLWIGTETDGLMFLDLGNAAPSVKHAPSTDRLQSVNVITSDALGSLWIGADNGLHRYNPATSMLERFVSMPTDHNMPSGSIQSMLTDRKGRLWVASRAVGGISILESYKADGSPNFRRLGILDGLPNQVVDTLLIDAAGNVWASTDSGVAVIDSNTLAIRALRGSDGLAISSYWSNSGTVTSNEEVLFGGQGGLTILRPNLLKEWTYQPPVVVTAARIGGKLIASGRLNSTDSSNVSAPLIIAADAKSLNVEFSSLDYSAPEMNQYAYWLEGHDKAWIGSDSARRVAAYTDLPPGEYRLHIRGSNRAGVWSAKELALQILVEPSWFQTAWFRICEGIFALLLIILSNRLWARKLMRQRAVLEEKVRARTATIEEKNAVIAKKAQELEAACRSLEELSVVDSLTSLHNRRYLLRNIDVDISHSLRQYGHWAKNPEASLPTEADVIFFMIDLDHFKSVNDTYGHAAGDMVLVQMSQRLKEVARESDYMIRWGGEEFLMVARMTNRDSAEVIAERIRNAISCRDFDVADNVRIHKTCSIGFACFPYLPQQANLLSWPDVVDIADHALYLAKHGGRNAWVGLCSTASTPITGTLRRVTQEIEQALIADEMRLVSSCELVS